MTIKRVQRAAELRGMYFDGIKKWVNSCIGYGYEIYTPNGFSQADTLDGIYKFVMRFEKEAK